MATQFTCAVGQLDEQTQEYLNTVHRNRGAGTPGVYLSEGNLLMPILSLVLAPVVLMVGLGWVTTSGKDGWAVALLATAVVMTSGWMFFYPFRRWFGGNTFYRYFDSTHVYELAGGEVKVTDLDGVEAVRSSASGNSGNVIFNIDSKMVTIPVPTAGAASLVENYYAALEFLETHPEKQWQRLEPAVQGGVAKYLLAQDDLPTSTDPDALGLDIVELPEQPRSTGGGGGGALRYFAILGLFGLVFAVCYAIFPGQLDHGSFAAAKAAGAPGLRAYLIDDRNTRHRDEAKELLAKLYDAPIEKVKSMVKDPELQKGFVALFESLRTAAQPAVSIKIEGPGGMMSPNNFADGFGMTFGKELIAFVPAPVDKEAHVTIKFTQPDGPAGVKYVMTIRTDPDSKPVAGSWRTVSSDPQNMDLIRLLFTDVFGTPLPIAPPPPPPDWE